jgi:predicted transcriptional regulator
MVRTQIYLSESQRAALGQLSARSRKGKSRLIREALDEFIAANDLQRRRQAVERSAGIWKDRRDLPDFGRIRRSWDR